MAFDPVPNDRPLRVALGDQTVRATDVDHRIVDDRLETADRFPNENQVGRDPNAPQAQKALGRLRDQERIVPGPLRNPVRAVDPNMAA